ncbi:MAG TPA: serine/threonine-protein kinase [Burkholderiales bacterium]|nr:serine/threonine-protein kinase [Burkholderiales bacterium]
MSDSLPQQIGKYPISREIGRGATSVVYLARDPFANREVAIKVLKNPDLEDTDVNRRFRKVFLNEAALVGKLFHPHILGIYDAVSEQRQSYIVMEYVAGKTLEYYCEASTLLPVSKVVEIVFKCSLALAFAQRHGVIHCDIKPANILISDDTNIKISDFGAAQYDEAQHTHLQGIGSPAYMSPEQVQDKEVTFHTDIYSLGVVMYQMLTGKLPFRASTKASLLYQVVNIAPVPPSTFRREVSGDLDRVVLRCLEKTPEARYATWADFSRELTHSYRNLETPVDTVTDTEKFSALKGLAFFREFRDQELWELLHITSWRKFLVDQVVIREGDSGDRFYVITSGEAKVSKAGRLLNILRPGDCFGEMLYFNETQTLRSTTITSLSPLSVIEIKASDLSQASDKLQKEMNKSFLRILIDRLTWANNRLSAA